MPTSCDVTRFQILKLFNRQD